MRTGGAFALLLLRALFLPFWLGNLFGAELLRYTVRADPFEVELTLPNDDKQTKSLPRQPSYFFHRANIRWPVPEGPAGQPIRCEIRWTGFPANWRLVNTYGMDRRIQRFETTLGKLRKAVFVGGDFRTARSKRGLMLVTRNSWKFSDTAALAVLDRVAESHTALWQDRGLPGHLVFLTPSNTVRKGEGRTNGAIVEILPETSEPEFAELLAHELFHDWNPRRLNYTDDEELYWFTEGFTEYYEWATLWRTGIWSFDQALASFNSNARTYFVSPARNLTPSRMVALRQSDPDANKLPYVQGFLLAAHWNLGGATLDLAMRKLLADNREPLSNARIAKALRSVGIEKPEDEIQRFVVEGRTIEPRADLFGRCATETKVEVRPFDIGFDGKESERTNVIHGVKPASNAWRAGVRDGQKWKGIDILWGDATHFAEIEIEDQQGSRRRVKYLPAAMTAAFAPQYTAKTGHCDPWRLTPASAKPN